MTHRFSGSLLVLAAGLIAGSVAAQTQTVASQRPAAAQELSSCRSIAADAERLACYDRVAAAFDAAEQSGELLVMDRNQVRETRRALFGFSLNAAPLFARGGPQEEVEAIETTLTRVSEGAYGKWVFTLENGSVWQQIDSERLTRTPRPGMEIRVRQGAVGSYLLSVAGARSVRVRRQE